MMNGFEASFEVGNIGQLVLLILAYAVALVIGFGLLQGLYVLLTLPMRRNERARLFLDLLELGLQEGRAPESAIVDAASSGDKLLGNHFHRLATLLAQGQRLGESL